MVEILNANYVDDELRLELLAARCELEGVLKCHALIRACG